MCEYSHRSLRLLRLSRLTTALSDFLARSKLKEARADTPQVQVLLTHNLFTVGESPIDSLHGGRGEKSRLETASRASAAASGFTPRSAAGPVSRFPRSFSTHLLVCPSTPNRPER